MSIVNKLLSDTTRRKLAYWLLKSSEQEIRHQLRRVERDMDYRSTELVQLNALLGIDPARKPEPWNVKVDHENYFIRWSYRALFPPAVLEDIENE